jgi:protein-S-isoprenylcysteine O-methyltransferase Ste14
LTLKTGQDMENLVLFVILSIPVLIISWRTLFNTRSHGFYRFFSWECIIWLFIANYKYWFLNPLSIQQIFSWIFLFWSAYAVIAGVLLLKKSGKPIHDRADGKLFRFEKTSEVVDHGIFRYIRHPLYSSLLFLTWGIFLKNPTGILFLIAVSATVFLFLTAISDEKECLEYFGKSYSEYKKRSKRFIPFII